MDALRAYAYTEQNKFSWPWFKLTFSHDKNSGSRQNSGFGWAAQTWRTARSLSCILVLTFFSWLQITAAAVVTKPDKEMIVPSRAFTHTPLPQVKKEDNLSQKCTTHLQTQGLGWTTQSCLPGTFLVLAVKVPRLGNLLSPGQSRMVGHCIRVTRPSLISFLEMKHALPHTWTSVFLTTNRKGRAFVMRFFLPWLSFRVIWGTFKKCPCLSPTHCDYNNQGISWALIIRLKNYPGDSDVQPWLRSILLEKSNNGINQWTPNKTTMEHRM